MVEPAGTGDFGAAARDHLAKAEEHNEATLATLTGAALEVCRTGHVIHAGGTGHSLALVLETFYRAGGLACVNPLQHAGLFPLSGGGPSTVMERTPGLAAALVEQARPKSGELGFVFSNSGTNAVPVELAARLRERGVGVVAVTSKVASAGAPARADSKLADVADHVLDTLVPAGDVAFPPDAPVTGALSSLVSVYLWQLLLTRLVATAQDSGVSLPLWRSNNAPGGEEHNRDLLGRYRDRIAAL